MVLLLILMVLLLIRAGAGHPPDGAGHPPDGWFQPSKTEQATR